MTGRCTGVGLAEQGCALLFRIYKLPYYLTVGIDRNETPVQQTILQLRRIHLRHQRSGNSTVLTRRQSVHYHGQVDVSGKGVSRFLQLRLVSDYLQRATGQQFVRAFGRRTGFFLARKSIRVLMFLATTMLDLEIILCQGFEPTGYLTFGILEIHQPRLARYDLL